MDRIVHTSPQLYLLTACACGRKMCVQKIAPNRWLYWLGSSARGNPHGEVSAAGAIFCLECGDSVTYEAVMATTAGGDVLNLAPAGAPAPTGGALN